VASSKIELRESRLACPVCIGARMVKVRPEPAKALTLDHCRRCGGIWFDAGEVAALRAASPQTLWAHVALSQEAFRMKCHACLASFRRNEAACPACGWHNVLECPRDGAPMARIERDGLTVDVCKRCRGVWFDNVELAEVWNRTLGTLQRRRPGAAAPADFAADHFLLYAMFWAPDLPLYAGYAAVQAIGPVVEVAGGAAGAAVEATGELAGGVFSAIAEIIAGIFDGI
jgi:Zn-finger nucleic acid-binding protein